MTSVKPNNSNESVSESKHSKISNVLAKENLRQAIESANRFREYVESRVAVNKPISPKSK